MTLDVTEERKKETRTCILSLHHKVPRAILLVSFVNPNENVSDDFLAYLADAFRRS